MMKKAIPILWNLLLTVCIILSVVVISIEICTYDDNFFEGQYKANGTAAVIGTDLPSLLLVTDDLQQYLSGTKQTLDVEVSRNGVVVPFFNEREKDHMVDVVKLFDLARTVKIACIAILLGYTVLCVCLKLNPIGKRFCAVYVKTLTAVGIVGFTLALFVSLNFDAAWTFFHTIAFSNDLWLLDPKTDMLINLVPLEFFTAMVARIGIYVLVALGSAYVACLCYLFKAKRTLEASQNELSKVN